MMKTAKAFAPANISCVFKIHKHKNPRLSGSTGFGFTLNKGVQVEVSKIEKTEIYFNNKKINFPTVDAVVKALTGEKVNIAISTSLPLGCGFGLSGASALATAYALNKLLELKKVNKQLAIIAHTAEAENGTGLGDVVNQYFGGMLVKFKPSSQFIVKKIPITSIHVYCAYFSKLSTRSILEDSKLRSTINQAAEIALQKIKTLMRQKNKMEFKDILKLSKEFSVNSGLLKNKETKDAIEKIEKNNGYASMIMLGNAVFSDKPFAGATKYLISAKPAHLL